MQLLNSLRHPTYLRYFSVLSGNYIFVSSAAIIFLKLFYHGLNNLLLLFFFFFFFEFDKGGDSNF